MEGKAPEPIALYDGCPILWLMPSHAFEREHPHTDFCLCGRHEKDHAK